MLGLVLTVDERHYVLSAPYKARNLPVPPALLEESPEQVEKGSLNGVSADKLREMVLSLR